MSLPRYEILLLGLLFIIILVAIFGYMVYWIRIDSHVRETADSAFGRKALMKALHMHQGSNFNTVLITSWYLLLVALIFLYFLTPEIFGKLNYFRFPQVSSSSFGLSILGSAIILIPGSLAALFIPKAYSYILISRSLKKLNLAAIVLLIISIFCSVNLGTIYPLTNDFYWNLGYLTLFISLIILLAPIVLGILEEMRT